MLEEDLIVHVAGGHGRQPSCVRRIQVSGPS
jgi:hypothetical protein